MASDALCVKHPNGPLRGGLPLYEERPNPGCRRQENCEQPTLDVVTRLDEEDDTDHEERDADDEQTDREQPDLELAAYGHVHLLDRGDRSDHERDLLVRVDGRGEQPRLDGVALSSHLRFAGCAMQE